MLGIRFVPRSIVSVFNNELCCLLDGVAMNIGDLADLVINRCWNDGLLPVGKIKNEIPVWCFNPSVPEFDSLDRPRADGVAVTQKEAEVAVINQKRRSGFVAIAVLHISSGCQPVMGRPFHAKAGRKFRGGFKPHYAVEFDAANQHG